MNINNAMPMDVLDILFANKNKMYGAYQLRRNYNKRLSVAVAIMLLTCLLFAIAYGLGKKESNITPGLPTVEVTIKGLAQDKPIVPPPPVKKVRIEQPVATIKLTTPVLVTEVTTPPPTMNEVDNVRIDVKTTAGKVEDYPMPPVESSTGAVQSLVRKESYDSTFITVQHEAQFPGGPDAWIKFLQRNLRSEVPTENGAAAGSYTVVVSFLVNKDGNISEVKAENDPGYGTAAEAVRVIERGPEWTPALQNGRNVSYRQKQAITFVVNQE